MHFICYICWEEKSNCDDQTNFIAKIKKKRIRVNICLFVSEKTITITKEEKYKRSNNKKIPRIVSFDIAEYLSAERRLIYVNVNARVCVCARVSISLVFFHLLILFIGFLRLFALLKGQPCKKRVFGSNIFSMKRSQDFEIYFPLHFFPVNCSLLSFFFYFTQKINFNVYFYNIDALSH